MTLLFATDGVLFCQGQRDMKLLLSPYPIPFLLNVEDHFFMVFPNEDFLYKYNNKTLCYMLS